MNRLCLTKNGYIWKEIGYNKWQLIRRSRTDNTWKLGDIYRNNPLYEDTIELSFKHYLKCL